MLTLFLECFQSSFNTFRDCSHQIINDILFTPSQFFVDAVVQVGRRRVRGLDVGLTVIGGLHFNAVRKGHVEKLFTLFYGLATDSCSG